MAEIEDFVLAGLNGHRGTEIFGDDSGTIRTLAFRVGGRITDVAYCDYGDKQLLIITQLEKIGTLILATKGCAESLNGIRDVYEVKTICGVDNQDYHLASRYLAEQLNIKKPVLFGICLKDVSVTALKSIADTLKANLPL